MIPMEITPLYQNYLKELNKIKGIEKKSYKIVGDTLESLIY